MSFTKTLARRLARKILRGIVTLSYDDNGIQRLQVKTLAGDVYELPRIQQYGLTANPHEQSEAVILMTDESNGLVIAVDDRRYRLRPLSRGEVALYDDLGSKVHLQRGGKMHLSAPNSITLDTPNIFATGNITAKGDILDQSGSDGRTMKSMRAVYNGHDHAEGVGLPTNKQ